MGSAPVPRITKFTNARLLRNGALIKGDLWVDSQTGKIMQAQDAFYASHLVPDQIINLNGKILSPGFIDVQLNGAYGFDFSVPAAEYENTFEDTSRKLIKTGVTSFVPTVTSQKAEVYQSVLPHLGAVNPKHRNPMAGSESLGAHVEGPFINPKKNGIHSPEVLIQAHSFSDLEACYGAKNFDKIRKITAAPELGNMMSLIPDLTSRGIIYSIGHSEASYEQAQEAVKAGATMVTHMFNAMRPFGHREPGIFGLLGQSPSVSRASSRPSTPGSSTASSPQHSPRGSRRSTPRSSLCFSTTMTDLNRNPLPENGKPYFGLIADMIHLSGPTLSIAHHAHPKGSILVTDAMPLAGLADGTYSWTNGERIIKKGPVLNLERNGRIAGSAVTLIECVNNFTKAVGCDWHESLEAVTSRPAAMLGHDVSDKKGKLDANMDADLVVLDEVEGEDGEMELRVEQVWKFGVRVA